MSITRGQIVANIQSNLGGSGVSFFSAVEINDSIQDGYNEVAALVLYNVKKVTLTWVPKMNYYDFLGDSQLGVTDFLGCIAIFNNATNQFLRDDIGMRDFDRLRRDWEWWSGAPQFWAPHSLRFVAVAPCYAASAAGQTFDLYYYAQSPALTSDSDVILTASDMADLMEFYATADLLESAEEPTKAARYWKMYYEHIVAYKERSHNLAKYELLMKV